MNRKILIQRNIKIMYIVAFTSNLAFFLPVLALFFNTVLNSVTLVALIFSIMSLTVILFELPTGAMADLFGRKKTMLIAGFLTLISFTILAFSTNFVMLVIYAFLFGLKVTLKSGAEEALYYDSLKELKKEEEYKKILGKRSVLTYIGATIGAVAGGIMASYHIRLPFFLTIPLVLFGLILTFLQTEPKYEKEVHRSVFRHIRTSFKTFVTNRQLLILSLFALLSYGIAEASAHLTQIFYDFVNLPIVLFGIVAALGSFMSVFGSWASHSISKKFGDKKTLMISKLVDGLLLLAAAVLLGYIGVLLLIVLSFFRSVGGPVQGHLLNKEIHSKNRSTILSIVNLLNNLGYIVFAPVLGYLADLYNIATSFRISGIILMLTVIFLLFIKNE